MSILPEYPGSAGAWRKRGGFFRATRGTKDSLAQDDRLSNGVELQYYG
jgi:hypothetical protein